MADHSPDIREASAVYGEEYYLNHCAKAHPYRHGDPEWEALYGRVADNIVRSLAPQRVYDAGCAIGFMVEALWDRGVEAWGRDISEYAISQVRPDVAEYCSVGSITDPVDGRFDLIICIEVLEHLTPSQSTLAIKCLTEATDQVLFSSTPSDFDEPTHINVRPPIYWLRQFAAHGFAPVLSYDATYLCPHAILFRRQTEPVTDEVIAAGAELVRWRVDATEQRTQAVALNVQLADALNVRYRLHSSRSEAIVQRDQSDQVRERQEQQIADLEKQAEGMWGHIHYLEAEKARLSSMEVSMFWRGTAPLRRVAGSVSPEARSRVRRAVRAVRLIASLRFGELRSPTPAVPAPTALPTPPPPTAEEPSQGPSSSLQSADQFPFLEPLRVFRAPDPQPTVNVITDSVLPGSMFGGVATALTLGSLLATRVGARLRLVTRTEPADAATVAGVLRQTRVPHDMEIETLFVGHETKTAVPLGDRDYHIATSWWTAAPTAAAIGYDRLIYLLQEDERMFYPMGDEFLHAAEVLGDPQFRTVINSEMLYRHLSEGREAIPALKDRAVFFEPAFPAELFHDDPTARQMSGKKNFLFYARPLNVRNLYWRGIQAIERAILEGTLDPTEWRFIFLGKEIKDTRLPGNPEVVVGENLSLEEYARHVRSAHVGLSLIYSPHPSYPPLDLAASGAVVVTNTFETSKLDLSSYSQNIICCRPTVKDLVAGIASAVRLAGDDETRLANLQNDGIQRDWADALSASVDQIVQWCDG
jgi:SAM-dependent methyltransferase